jgi:hypothetical protein
MSALALSFSEAVSWTQRLLALALLLQTIEWLQARRLCADDGVWRWQVLKAEQRELPFGLRALLAPFMPYRGFLALLWCRVVLVALLAVGWGWAAPLLLVSQLAICVRFRGTFNGGSDYMSVVVLLSLTGCQALARWPSLAKACLAYACVQLVFSYFIAGVVKQQNRDWRTGKALASFVGSGLYGTPAWLVRALSTGSRPTLASWTVMGFECGFPAALLSPVAAASLLLLGALFHLGNAAVFGLNRFLFAWLAAYPSLLYFSAALVRS